MDLGKAEVPDENPGPSNTSSNIFTTDRSRLHKTIAFRPERATTSPARLLATMLRTSAVPVERVTEKTGAIGRNQDLPQHRFPLRLKLRAGLPLRIAIALRDAVSNLEQ